MPERLIEARAALGKDPFIKSLGRATFVDRVARDFSAFDSKIHADTRRRFGSGKPQGLSVDPFSERRSKLPKSPGDASGRVPRRIP